MNFITTLDELGEEHRQRVGGKALNLAILSQAGFSVPDTVCLTTDAYEAFLDRDGLRERILMILNRKPFRDMRWEEIWDAALRIRNLFTKTPLPEAVADAISRVASTRFYDIQTVIRSSAPGEDDAGSSFAGLHASYVNIRGTADILAHIKKVWASLWSDAALLYRQELGLSVSQSAMAVVIQEMVPGNCAGVFFGKNPLDPDQAVLEAVYGLNPGFVDGQVQPDRWIFDRAAGRVVRHTPVARESMAATADTGVALVPVPHEMARHPPLTPNQLETVFKTAQAIEDIFRSSQDIEWTFRDEHLVILQTRPITTVTQGETDGKRAWYLSLHRSIKNLEALRHRIENELIPEMITTAEDLGRRDLTRLSDRDLLEEISRRREITNRWVQTYWRDFIPFAHGMRLFGQVYNDAMRPEDPYEFMILLERTEMKSMERNRRLESLADLVRTDTRLRQDLVNGQPPAPGSPFQKALAAFIDTFGDLSCPVTGGTQCQQGEAAIVQVVLKLAERIPVPFKKHGTAEIERLKERFFHRVEAEGRVDPRALLALGRSSYQLRDDDNIYLGRLEARLRESAQEAQRRISGPHRSMAPGMRTALEGIVGTQFPAAPSPEAKATPSGMHAPSEQALARQLTGQPAGPGIATGRARVISHHDDLISFTDREILVVDAVDPNMTFIVPLAAGIVERRGGMLIHGAIIAREYGIPCVTGVPDAVSGINTGDQVTVDGYLGIVTIDKDRPPAP